MISATLGFVVVIGCYLSCSDSLITNSIGRGEIEQMKERSFATLRNPRVLSETFFALQILNAAQVTEFPRNCDIIEKSLQQPSSILDAYYGVTSAAACGCRAQITSAIAAESIIGLKVDLCLISFTVLMIICMTFQQTHATILFRHEVQRFRDLCWVRFIEQDIRYRDRGGCCKKVKKLHGLRWDFSIVHRIKRFIHKKHILGIASTCFAID